MRVKIVRAMLKWIKFVQFIFYKQFEELVNYIDSFMSKSNAGHMNITVNENGQINKNEQLVDNTGNCHLSACKAPTLFDGLDYEDEYEEA